MIVSITQRRIRLASTASIISHSKSRSEPSQCSVVVIGAGISGIAAARALTNASCNVVLLESRDRIGGRVHTDYTFGFPVDMGASWLHGACEENSLAPLIRSQGLTLYRTSEDNNIMYDHDLKSYALFDMNGHQLPHPFVEQVGETLKRIYKETEIIREEYNEDMSIQQAINIVLEKHPELKLEDLGQEVVQWFICRMEAWFAADSDMISLKSWHEDQVLPGGHALMVEGYLPVIQSLAEGLDIRLNHRVTKIEWSESVVSISVQDGTRFETDAVIITVPLGVLQKNLIEFHPSLPQWKINAIQDLGFGNMNKVALYFDEIFWPDVELLGVVASTSDDCGYFINIHKATGHPVLVYMVAGSFANEIEELSDEKVADIVMSQLKKVLPDARKPIKCLISRWGTDPNSLGTYSYDLVGKPSDVYEKLGARVNSLFFAGEAVSVDHPGCVHGAYSSGILASQQCMKFLCKENAKIETCDIICKEREVSISLRIFRR